MGFGSPLFKWVASAPNVLPLMFSEVSFSTLKKGTKMVQRKWEITEECVREMAATAPEGFPDYESNKELWKELVHQLWEGDYLNQSWVNYRQVPEISD